VKNSLREVISAGLFLYLKSVVFVAASAAPECRSVRQRTRLHLLKRMTCGQLKGRRWMLACGAADVEVRVRIKSHDSGVVGVEVWDANTWQEV
jgi:hypothetical protein